MSNTQNVRLGVCRVIFGGVDLGYTQGGVEVEVKTETHPVQVDQFGKSVINELIMGRTCSVKTPLAETTLDNLVRIMPGSSLVEVGGTYSAATFTFTAPAVANDTITVNGVVFTAATTVTLSNQFQVGTTAADQATKFAAAVNAGYDPNLVYSASAVGAIVTLTADNYDTPASSYNVMTLTKTSTAITTLPATFSGGVAPSKKMVTVPTAVNTSLLATAKYLTLHPMGNADTDRSEDFNIPFAATAGGLKFAYMIDKERIYDVSFNAYHDPVTTTLFIVGDPGA